MAKRDQEDALLKALGHPLRKWLLRLCVEEGEGLSPKELALVMRQSLSTISYHARKLKELGALELVHEEPVRGAVAHFYEPTDLVKETPWVLAVLGLEG
jgi:DNA-binding transcriptional ArsR family regulator